MVLEEGDPLIEEVVSTMHSRVRGKLDGSLASTGALDVMEVKRLLGVEYTVGREVRLDVPERKPSLCPGCPHRPTFHALKEQGYNACTGDIGCYALGAQEPLSVMDTCLCMGASIGQAAGLNHGGVENIYAVVGDSTFLHSGLPSLLNAAYNGAEFTLIILDNHNTAMTGHQPTPLSGVRADKTRGTKVKLEKICGSLGAGFVKSYNPFELEEVRNALKEASGRTGVKVLISDGACQRIGGRKKARAFHVDEDECRLCGRCLELGCPAIRRMDDKVSIDGSLCSGCGVCRQVCQNEAIKG